MLRRGIVLGGYAWRLPIDRDTSNLYLRQGWSSSFDLFVPEMSVAQFALRLVAISRGCDPTRMILCVVSAAVKRNAKAHRALLGIQ